MVVVHQPIPARASAPPAPASAAMPPIAPSGPSAPAMPVSRPDAVARVVMSLLSYARWPGERETLRLCVDGSARFAGKLMEGGTLSSGRLVETRRVDGLPESLASQCDALYLGAMNDARRRALTAYFVGKPVLVMTEEDFECEGGSMFCLSIREHQVSFRINLDAIARSGIHVHPGVLQLGRRKAPAS
ncbi:YfiR family protein [Ralstonia sp. 25mfcol4.1]|uniref:YfiR family protein n=1 Tax=Ralstonia sp. 25mfcol4.1 TaxID=1761899 RepID=UPI0034A33062